MQITDEYYQNALVTPKLAKLGHCQFRNGSEYIFQSVGNSPLGLVIWGFVISSNHGGAKILLKHYPDGSIASENYGPEYDLVTTITRKAAMMIDAVDVLKELLEVELMKEPV